MFEHDFRYILITDEVHSLLPNGLQALGFGVHYRPKIKPEEVLEEIGNYEGLVVNSKVYVGKEMMDKGSKLKFVCRAGSGLEVIDLEYAREKNIIAFNSPEGNRNAVAEFALGALLNMMRNIARSNAEVKKGEWNREENRGDELSGKTIGMMGYGNAAQAFAKLLKGFDIQILAFDKYYHGFTADHVKEATLEEIFERADVLSIHLPLTAETTYVIDQPFLSKFKKPIWLLNTSRGKVLDTSALLWGIAEGPIIAASLDVLENEKINALTPDQQQIFNQLVADNSIFLSPHIAGWTHESKIKIAEVLLTRIEKVYAGVI